MKAFFIILLILVIAAGVVFYFGWIQIQLAPEQYGVIFTKTSGYDPNVVRPGEFVWRWEKLIPTNLTLYRFDSRSRREEVSFGRKLPSADLYSSVLPESPDFIIRGRLEVVFTVKPDALPALVEQQKLTPESLDNFYDSVGSQMTEAVQARLQNIDATDLGRPLEPSIREELGTDMPFLEIVSLSLVNLETPDMELYELARQSYRTLLETYEEARNAAAARLAVEEAQENRRSAADDTRRENLRKYGALFNEYPVLLKALAIQQLAGSRQADIPELDLSDVLDFSVDR
jgi:hypothetical protein